MGAWSGWRNGLPSTDSGTLIHSRGAHAAACGPDGDHGESVAGLTDGATALCHEVAHLVALGFEVALEGGFGGDGGGDALDDGDAGGFEGGDLLGVVGDEADAGDAELAEDGGGEFELAVVGAEAEAFVGFDGVETLVLQFVGAELGHEADAAALLLFVEQDAGALAGDEAEREVELVVAVAAQGVEDVSGEALGVDADQRRGFGVEVAHGERDGVFDRAAVGVGVAGRAAR